MLNSQFGPQNEAEALIFIETNLRIDVLMLVQAALDRKGVNLSEFSSQFPGWDKGTLSFKRLVRIMYYLGERVEISTAPLRPEDHPPATRVMG